MNDRVGSARRQAEFYSQLFAGQSGWASAFANVDEAARAGKVLPILSRITSAAGHASPSVAMRMLDLGCGRGWLTYLANAFAPCEGADPVSGVIEAARHHYPKLSFQVGTARDLAAKNEARSTYNVIICSEVIEHVPYGDQDAFLEDIKKLLVEEGHLILTTPRQELRRKFFRWRRGRQPIEDWLSEKELSVLASSHGFAVRGHDRAYVDIRRMSVLNAFCRNRRIERLLDRCNLAWAMASLKYAASIYQVWWFQR